MSFSNLVSAYKTKQIELPSLKAITLAQWMLESGRGTSILAKEHNNFGGLKWRKELESKVSGVTKVFYNEGRGEADKFYFGCKTEADFINLYWAFIERSPYSGWREAANVSPENYLRHIAFKGYVGGSVAAKEKYVKNVLSLLLEATELLKSEPTEGDKTMDSLKNLKVALDCGHGYYEGNAVFDSGASGAHGTTEQAENLFYAIEAARILKERGAIVSVFDYSKKGSGLSLGEKGARGAGHDLFVSCHLNSVAGGTAQGTEVLYEKTVGTAADKAFAATLNKALVSALGFADRGAKPQGLGVLKGVPPSVKAAVLCEPFFVNSTGFKSAAEVREASKKAAQGLANGIIAYAKQIGLATSVDEAPAPTPTPSPTSDKFLRVSRIDGKDANQIQKLKLELCEYVTASKYRVLESMLVRSGLPGYQEFKLAAESKEKSHEPIPEGYYKLGPVEWAGGKDNYNASWKTGIGATWTDCLPQMATGRSAIGIHLDTNVPGTEGCVGLLSVADEKKYVGWRKAHSLTRLHVNYGLGSVETKLSLVSDAPVAVPPPVTTQPVKDENWLIKALTQVIDFIKGIISKISGSKE